MITFRQEGPGTGSFGENKICDTVVEIIANKNSFEYSLWDEAEQPHIWITYAEVMVQ